MRIIYFTLALTFLSFFANAQTTGYSGTGGNIDVDNYQIFWRVDPDSLLGIKGTVKIKFKTTLDNVTRISFDLRSVLNIDNVTFRGLNVTAGTTRTGNTFSVPANIALLGTRDSITVSYSGAPPTGNRAETGYTKATGAGGNVVYTLSESYEDRDWWPCKADMQDKADTIDITVNVPYRTNNANASLATDTFWVASNGTLVDSTIDLSGTQANRNRTFKYINRYPMTSYLVCLGIARYNRYYRTPINVSGFNLPVVYYLYAGKSAATYTNIIAAMDVATELVEKFGEKFGPYPFPDPTKGGKHGFYEGCPGGAMEHQTFSAMSTGSIQSKSTLVHELMHQWFGDKVSFATWNDLWLAEAFAEYAPSLAAELVTGMGFTAFSSRDGIKSTSLMQTAPVYIPNSGIATSNTIWDGSGTTAYGQSVYERGAMVVSMLRTICGDTKFFNILKDYQLAPGLAYKTATYDTLVKRFSDSLGVDITEFFADNVKGTGYADYTISYRTTCASNKTLLLGVVAQTQKRGNPSILPASTVTYFNNPIVVHVKGLLPVEDTTIVFYDWGAGVLSKSGNGLGPKISGNLLSYQLSFTPITFAYDDSARTMSVGTLVPSIVLDLKTIDFTVKKQNGYNNAVVNLDDNSTNTPVFLEVSTNGINFNAVGQMVLQANTNATKKYVLNDFNASPAELYYRAKYKNANNEILYSPIVKISNTLVSKIKTINNPAKNVLQLNTSSVLGKNIGIEMYDASLKLVVKKQIKNVGAVETIALKNIKIGVYFAKIILDDGSVEVVNFVVQ